ncbi:MAG: TonB-dependent receptor domain-containing protein [bacterium]
MKMYQKKTLVPSLMLLMALSRVVLSHDANTLGGRVLDAATREPLAGANVEIVGTVLGASTARDGRFVIRQVPPGVYKLRASMMGYQTEIVDSVTPFDANAQKCEITLVETPVVLNPVVVTAERRAQGLEESPNSISVLSLSEIRSRNSVRLDEALEMVPGIYFMKDDVSIRGSTGYRSNSANRVLLLVDGIPVMTSDIGGISWDMLPILDIERVEVVKGAGSALWGSYAIGGVINIITTKPDQKGALNFRVTGGIYDRPSVKDWNWAPDRTLGYNRVDIAYGKAFGHLGMRFSFSRYASTGDRLDGDFEKWNLSGKLSYRFRDASKLDFYLAWLKDRSGVFVQWRSPFVADSTDATPSQLFHPLLPAEEGNMLRLNWINTYVKYSKPLSTQSSLKIRASLLRSMLGNQFQVSGDFFPANGLGGAIQFDWLPNTHHFLTIGMDFKLNLVRGVFFGGKHTELLFASFLQEEWRILSNLRISAGFRFDRNTLIDGPVNYQFNPRLGFNYHPWASLILRGSAGRGFRSPTIAERTIHFDTGNFVIVPNPLLQPESSWAYEVGVKKKFASVGYLDAAIFYNDFKNFIEAQPDLAQTDREIVVSFQNVPQARIRGVEVSAGCQLWDNRLRLNSSVMYLDTKNLALDKPLAYRPRWIAQINPSLHFGPFQCRADYRYASRLQRVEIYTLDQRVEQHEFNIRLQYNFKNLSFVVGSDNVLNYNYTQVERNLGEIRNFRISVNGSF